MKAKWLIESGLFLDTEPELLRILKEKGYEVKTLKYIPFDDDLINHCAKLYDNDNECVVFYGSLNFARKLRKLQWIPGVYGDYEKYKCTSYYPVFGDLLVHNNYIMMPYGDLLRRKEYLFETFGHIFLRPDSSTKEFTGMVLDWNNFEDGIKLAGFYDVEPDLLVVVSEAKELSSEYRFVVVNQEVISGSLYRDWSKKGDATSVDFVLRNSGSVKEGCKDKKVWKFAQECAKKYNPEIAWTLDIAEMDDGTYGVLEVGCFSSAGMYGNDLNIIVDKISEAAVKEWEEYFN